MPITPAAHLATVCLVVLLLVGAARAQAAPGMSLSFGFEPRVGTYAADDAQLADYGFAPVGSALLPAWGLRGRAFVTERLFVGLAMTYGLRVAEGPVAPTTVTLTETALGAGYRFPWGGFASVDVGFAAQTTTLASRTDGGALVQLGPVVHPRVGWARQFTAPFGWFLAVSAGVNLHFPLGAPHSNPLWEASFRRAVQPALTLGIESGLGLMGGGA